MTTPAGIRLFECLRRRQTMTPTNIGSSSTFRLDDVPLSIGARLHDSRPARASPVSDGRQSDYANCRDCVPWIRAGLNVVFALRWVRPLASCAGRSLPAPPDGSQERRPAAPLGGG